MSNNSSIDSSELQKFNKTYQEWWDKDGEFKKLHEINPLRIDYITSLIKQHFKSNNAKLPLAGKTLIDIGSGGGLVCASMSGMGGEITGLDANSHNTKAAREHAQHNNLNINYINSTIEEYAKTKQQYDVVLCLEVIEHVANPGEFAENVAKIVAPGGLLVFSTINRTRKAYFLAIIMAEHVLGWVRSGTHDYNKFVKPSELVRMLQDSELNLLELKGLEFSPLSQDWHLSDNIDINYFASFKKYSTNLVD